MTFPRICAIALLSLLVAPTVLAEWHKEYEAGLKAAEAEQWEKVVTHMTAAIAEKPKENSKERPYGTIFIAYHPYYYRGVAYYNLEQWDRAIADLERATGVGRVKFQSADTLMDRARAKTAAPPPATPVPPPPQQLPPPSLPSTPAVDPNIETNRTRATGALSQARAAEERARQNDAKTLAATQYVSGMQSLNAATSAQVDAKTAADWTVVANTAERARREFEQAATQAQLARTQQQTAPTQAADAVLGDTKKRVVLALEKYFKGNFDAAARDFEALAQKDLSSNAMIWAFLGAARYSKYYLDGERAPAARKSAEDAFRRAKSIKRSMNDLPSAYFSPRIRTFYRNVKVN